MKIIWLVCIIVISNQLDCGRANAYVQHDMLEYNIADSMRTAQKGTNFLNIFFFCLTGHIGLGSLNQSWSAQTQPRGSVL